jgi:hypothetical protein
MKVAAKVAGLKLVRSDWLVSNKDITKTHKDIICVYATELL